MEKVADVQVFKDFEAVPTLIFIDLQKEYACTDRRLGIQDLYLATNNCGLLLNVARRNRYPVVFTRWVQHATVFRKNGRFTEWLDGFQPTGSDMVIDHAWPSCYHSNEFAQIMDCGGGRNAVIAGLTSTMACLATIIDGSQRNHKFTFISDASACHRYKDISEAEMHEKSSCVIGSFAQVSNTTNWIAGLEHTVSNRHIRHGGHHVCR